MSRNFRVWDPLDGKPLVVGASGKFTSARTKLYLHHQLPLPRQTRFNPRIKHLPDHLTMALNRRLPRRQTPRRVSHQLLPCNLHLFVELERADRCRGMAS